MALPLFYCLVVAELPLLYCLVVADSARMTVVVALWLWEWKNVQVFVINIV